MASFDCASGGQPSSKGLIPWFRSLLGLCNHEYQLIERIPVLKRSDGTFTSIDNAGKYVTHVVFVRKCDRCNKLRHYNVHLVK